MRECASVLELPVRHGAEPIVLWIEMDKALVVLARRLIWWKQPEEVLADPNRFVAQVMTYGTWQDILESRKHFGETTFQEALQHAPPGVFDARSWVYWHHALRLYPVPPLPVRNFANGP